MSDVNFTPSRGAYKELTPFRYWCQKVLPLVYDDSISYYELLCKVVNYLNITMEDVSTLNDDVTAMYTAYNELQDFVNQYFTDLNIQTQIDNKLDRMAADGSLNALIDPLVAQTTVASVAENLPDVVEDQLPDVVEDQITGVVENQIGGEVARQITTPVNTWLTQNLSQPTNVVLDQTVTISGAAPDAYQTGKLFDDLIADGRTNILSYFQSGNMIVADDVAADRSSYGRVFIGVSQVAANRLAIIPASAGDNFTYVINNIVNTDYNIDYVFYAFVNNGREDETTHYYTYDVLEGSKIAPSDHDAYTPRSNGGIHTITAPTGTEYVIFQCMYETATIGGEWYSPNTYIKNRLEQKIIPALNNLKADFNQITYKTQISDIWSSGSIKAADGSDLTSPLRIKTDIIHALSVKPESGYQFLLYAYNGSEYIGCWNGTTFVKTTTGILWINSEIQFQDYGINYSYRIVGRKQDDSAISVSESSNFIFTLFTDTSLSKIGKAADAYTVGNKFDTIDTAIENIEGTGSFVPSEITVPSDADYPTYYINNGGNILSLGSEYTTFNVSQYPISGAKKYFITGTASLNGDFPIAGFKTTSGASGTCSIVLMGGTTEQAYNYLFSPASDGYLFIASVANKGTLTITEAIQRTALDDLKDKAAASVVNQWYGKKVVWIGTSVSFGQYATKSYPDELSKYLGFELVNCSVPGLSITLNNGEIKQYGSLSATKAEYAAAGITIPDEPITPYVPGGRYNGYYRTWENVFTQENADADIWVFDCVPNTYPNFGLDDWNAFNKSTWQYNDSSSFASHRNTFLGALIYLMDKMYTLNPNARMVFVLGSSFDYASGKSELETMAAQWKMGIIDLWGKINTSPQSLVKLKSENGTNPHPSTFAHEIMGKMLIGEFNRFA